MKNEQSECLGLVLRGFNKVFYSNGRVEQRKGFNILKRKSCKGCPECEGLKEQLVYIDICDLGEIEDGELYEGVFDCQGDIDFIRSL